MTGAVYGVAGVQAPAGKETAALRAQLVWAFVLMALWIVVAIGWLFATPAAVMIGLASAFAWGLTSPACRVAVDRTRE